jgi:hypothetical protein
MHSVAYSSAHTVGMQWQQRNSAHLQQHAMLAMLVAQQLSY